MTTQSIPVFYYPTSVVFVDDSATFLSNLSLQLDADLAFRLYRSPAAALSNLNGASDDSKPILDYFAFDNRDRPQDAHVVELSLSAFHREAYNEKRFNRISAVVVDYNMPDIDGLDFCRRITDRSIKRILLTGVADEHLAVQAFNEGIIDRFIRKQEPGAMEIVNRTVAEMQQSYFLEAQQVIFDVLSVGPPRFVQDAAFAERFQQIRRELGIVEYYYVHSPDGMLMLTATGIPYLLLVQSEESVRACYEIAYDQAAPEGLLADLSDGHVVPYFWKTAGLYSPVYEHWRDYLYPATELKGKEFYLYSVVKNPPGINSNHLFPYDAYLGYLDAETSGTI